MMKPTDIIFPLFFFGITFGAMCFNAYHHNFQLLALWIIVTTQGLALGNILLRIKTNK